MARNVDTSHPILQLSERFQEKEYLEEKGIKSDYHKYQSRSSCSDYRKKQGRNPQNLHVINTGVYNTLETFAPHKSKENSSLIVLKTEQPKTKGHFFKHTGDTHYQKHFTVPEPYKRKSKKQRVRERKRNVSYIQASDHYRWYSHDHKVPEPPLQEEAENFDDISDAPLEDGEFEEVEVAPIFDATKEFKVPVRYRKYKPLYLKYRHKFYKAKFYIIPCERMVINCSVTQSTSHVEVDIVSEAEDDNDEALTRSSGNTKESYVSSKKKLGENSNSYAIVNSNLVDVQNVGVCVNDDVKVPIERQISLVQSNKISKPVDKIYHCSLSPSVSSSNFYQGKSIIQMTLDSWKSHLIGLEYILEIRNKLSEKSAKKYCCVLCEENIPDISADSIISHIVKYKHMVKYLEKHFPTCGYKNLENDGGNCSEILLQKCCEEINSVCGYSYMCITSCDYYETHVKEIKDTINKCKHFSEVDCHLNMNEHEKILEGSIYKEVVNLVNDICKILSDGHKIDVSDSACHRTLPKYESTVSTPSKDIIKNKTESKVGVNTKQRTVSVHKTAERNAFLSNYKMLVEYDAKTFKAPNKRDNPHKEMEEKKNDLPKLEAIAKKKNGMPKLEAIVKKKNDVPKLETIPKQKSKSVQIISSISVKSKFKNKSLSAYLKQKYSRGKARKAEYIKKAKDTKISNITNKELDSKHVPAEIELLPPDENQVLPSDENKVLASSENQVLPSDENQVLPSDENQVLPSDENQVLPSDENQVLPSDENQVLTSDENEVIILDANEVMVSNANEVLPSDENQEQDSSSDIEIIEIKEQVSEKNDKASVKIIPDQKIVQKSNSSKSKGHAKSSVHSKHCPKRNLSKGSVSKSGSGTKKTVTKSTDLDGKGEKSKSLVKKSEKNKSRLEKNNLSEHRSREVRISHRKTNSPSKRKSPSKTQVKSKADSSSRKQSRSPARKHSHQSQVKQLRKTSKSPVSRQKGSATRSVKSPHTQRVRSPLRRSIRSPIRLHSRSSARKNSRSPVRKFIRSPLRRCSRSPARRVSRSPARRVSRSPARRVSRSPARRVSRSPARRVLRSPARRVSRSPARRVSRSPARRVSRSPARRVSRSPARRVSRSPARRVSRSPARRISRSPFRRQPKSPLSRQPRSPLRRQPRSPLRRQSRSPLRRQSRSPLRRQSRSPRKYLKTSTKRYSNSPVRRCSRSPYRTVRNPLTRRSRSPVRYSRSPLRRRSRSPVKRYSRSPVRESRSSLIQHSRSPLRDSNALQRGHIRSPVRPFSRGVFINDQHYDHKIRRSEHSAKIRDKLSPSSLESRFARAITDLDPISDEDESTYFNTMDKQDHAESSKLPFSSQNVLAQILQKFSTTDMNSNDPSVQRLMQFMNAHSTEIQQLLDSHPNPNTCGSDTVHHHRSDMHTKSALQQYLLSNLAGNSSLQQPGPSYSTPIPSSGTSFPSQSFHHDAGHPIISGSFSQSAYSSFPENQSHAPINPFNLHHHSLPPKPQVQSEVMFNDLKARVNKLFGGNESASKTEKEKSVAHVYVAEPDPAKWNLSHPNTPKFSATHSFNSLRSDTDFRGIPENTVVQEGVTRPLSKNSMNTGHFFTTGGSQERLNKHKMPVPPPDAKVSFCDAPRSLSHRNLFPVVNTPGMMNVKSQNDNEAADIKVSLAQRLASVLVKVGMLDVPAPLLQEMLMKIGAFSSCPPQDISEAEIITILRKLRYVT